MNLIVLILLRGLQKIIAVVLFISPKKYRKRI
jgi:hypothetical protein